MDVGRPPDKMTVHLNDGLEEQKVKTSTWWTSDHVDSWQVDKSERPDGLTAHLMDGFGQQSVVIPHR